MFIRVLIKYVLPQKYALSRDFSKDSLLILIYKLIIEFD